MHKSATGDCEPTSGRQDGYALRSPEDTALYQCVAEYWPEFRERMAEHGGLPGFVEEEFNSTLTCGRLEAGRLELECRCCGHSMLVAFSCKRRGAAAQGAIQADTQASRIRDESASIRRRVTGDPAVVAIRHGAFTTRHGPFATRRAAW